MYMWDRSVAETSTHSSFFLELALMFCWTRSTKNKDYISQPSFQLDMVM
jgi:hypothetical protein